MEYVRHMEYGGNLELEIVEGGQQLVEHGRRYFGNNLIQIEENNEVDKFEPIWDVIMFSKSRKE